jgi:YVTN family beta-propeller protein
LGLQNAWADSVIATIPVGDNPYMITFDSVNGDVYVTNAGLSSVDSNTVTVIDPTTNKVISTVQVGDHPHGVGFDSRNGDVYVANLASETVSDD